MTRASFFILFAHKGLAIGALDHCGILLVAANSDLIKSAVVAIAGVICTLGYGTFDLRILTVLINFSFPLTF